MNILEVFKREKREILENTYKTMEFRETEEQHSGTVLTNWFRQDFIIGEDILYFTTWTCPGHINFDYYITNLTRETERLLERVDFYTTRDKYCDTNIATELMTRIASLNKLCKVKITKELKN